MILDMSPTPTGLLQRNDVQTYGEFGAGAQALYDCNSGCDYPSQPVADAYPAKGVATVELELPSSNVSRGAIELRENLTLGQAVESYNVSHSADGQSWQPLPLRNEGMLTIGNRRIQYWDKLVAPVGPHIKVEVQTLLMASGQRAAPHLRSVKLMDWSSTTLDPFLSSILAVP